MRPRFVLGCAVLCFCITAVSFSQDAVKVDPKHYKVETENAQVRVLRVHYGPHEKSVLHSHPNSVAVFLTDGSVRFTDAMEKIRAGITCLRPIAIPQWLLRTTCLSQHWHG